MPGTRRCRRTSADAGEPGARSGRISRPVAWPRHCFFPGRRIGATPRSRGRRTADCGDHVGSTQGLQLPADHPGIRAGAGNAPRLMYGSLARRFGPSLGVNSRPHNSQAAGMRRITRRFAQMRIFPRTAIISPDFRHLFTRKGRILELCEWHGECKTLNIRSPEARVRARATSFVRAPPRPADRASFMGSLLHRLTAALLVLAFLTPAGPMCASATAADPMAGMSCCKKQAPATGGSMERDCCRMSEQLPEQAPATPAAPRNTVQSDAARALVALPLAPVTDDSRAHHDLLSGRTRPHAPVFLRTSVLLI